MSEFPSMESISDQKSSDCATVLVGRNLREFLNGDLPHFQTLRVLPVYAEKLICHVSILFFSFLFAEAISSEDKYSQRRKDFQIIRIQNPSFR